METAVTDVEVWYRRGHVVVDGDDTNAENVRIRLRNLHYVWLITYPHRREKLEVETKKRGEKSVEIRLGTVRGVL